MIILILKIITYIAVIPLIGLSIAIISLHFYKGEPNYIKEPTIYWWFDRGNWIE